MDKAKKTRRKLPLAILGSAAAVLVAPLIYFLACGGIVSTAPRPEHPARLLLPEGSVVRQSFQARHDNLSGIELPLAPNIGLSMAFRIYEDSGDEHVLLLTRQVGCERDSQACRVTFPAIKNSAGKNLSWAIDQIEPEDKAIEAALLINLDGRAMNGVLEINGRSTYHDAIFAPLYRSVSSWRLFLQDALTQSLRSSQAFKRLALLTLNSLIVLALLLFSHPRRSTSLTTFEIAGTLASLPAVLLALALLWAVVLKPDPWSAEFQDEAVQEIAAHCLTGSDCLQRALDDLRGAHRLRVDFGEQMRLAGYSLKDSTLVPGGTLHLTLYWHRLRQIETDYSIFVHLVDESGEIIAQDDSYPAQGSRPTTSWLRDDEVIVDTHQILIPESVASQTCHLQLGVYYWVDLSRLPALEGGTESLPDAAFQLPQEIGR